jgi:hypothetical protein
MSGPWLLVKQLLAAVAAAPGNTSPEHTSNARLRAAAARLPGFASAASPVRGYVLAAADGVLAAHDDHSGGSRAVFVDAFHKIAHEPGTLHAGGALPFRGVGDADRTWWLYRLRTGPARPPDASAQRWAVTAAHVYATEYPTLRTVHVAEVGGSDGSLQPVGTWTRSQLATVFAGTCASAFPALSRDDELRAGAHCAGCAFVGLCPEAPRHQGLLRSVPRQRVITKLTAGDLDGHMTCPARYRLQRINGLPAQRTDSRPAHLGRLTGDCLSALHRDLIRCDDTASVAAVAGISDPADKGAVLAMLDHHRDVCPIDDSVTLALAEPSLVALDADSNVLLVGRPDLVVHAGGVTRWRETKTGATPPPDDPLLLLDTSVTAALYVLLIAARDSDADVLEWEHLGPDGALLVPLDVTDPDLVEVARRTVSAAVSDLLSDDVRTARPGRACEGCGVRQWCPDAQ